MFRRLSIKVKMVVLFLLVGLLPVVTIGIITYQQSSQNIEAEVFGAMDLYADSVDAKLEDYFAEREGDAQVLAVTRDVYQSLNTLRDANWATDDLRWQERIDILDEFAAAVVSELGYAFIFLTNPDGIIVYSDREDLFGADISMRDYVQGAMQGQLTWSDLFFSEIIFENCMVVSAPVRSEGRSGEIIGTMNMLFDQDMINRMVHEGLGELGETGDAYLIDSNGLLLTNTRLGDYRRDAALEETIRTRAVEILGPEIRTGNMNFEANEVYNDYLGNRVLGALEVSVLGDMPVGLVVEIDYDEVFAGMNAMRRNIIIIGLVAAVIIAGLSYFFATTMTNPIIKMMELMGLAEKGDLTVHSELKQQDELGRLSESFNNMLAGLRNSMNSVLQSAESVDSASVDISTSTEQMSSGAQNQAGSVEELTATMEEMNASIAEVADKVQQASEFSDNVSQAMAEMNESIQESAKNAEQVAHEADRVQRSVNDMNEGINQSSEQASNTESEVAATMEVTREGQEQVKKTVSEMETINEAVSELAKVIGDLGDSAGKIGEIVEVIDDIAEQTNLLALNAAIEAARAGEHGKGFAVVAGAIGSLAERSQEATKDIADLIKGIQGEVQEAVRNSEEGSKKVEQGAYSVQEAGEAFNKIFDAVQNITERIKVIVENIAQQAKQSSDVRDAVESITKLIQEVSAAGEEQSASAEEASRMVEQMAEIARDVAAATEEQSASTDEVVKTAENVSNITTENAAASEEIASTCNNLRDLSQGMMEMVQKFKLA